MNNNQNKKRSLIAKISGIVLGIALVLGVSYAIFRTSDIAEKTNRINTADFNVEIQNESDTAIALENAIPMKALEGQKQDPYTFDIVNTGTLSANYTLYLEVPNNSTLPANKIKYYLARTDTDIPLTLADIDIDETIEPTDSLEELRAWGYSSLLSQATVSEEEGTTLYTFDTGVIGPGQRQSYRLNMWVSYEAGVEAANKSFEGKIRVDAEQANVDAIYPLKTVSLCEKETICTLKTSLYSDYSMHFEGAGIIDSNALGNNLEAQLLVVDDKTLLSSLNEILKKYDYEEISTIEQLIEFNENYVSDSVPEAMDEELNELFSNMPINFNGEIYFGDGISQIGSKSDNDSVFNNFLAPTQIEKVYISESVGLIDGANAFRNVVNLKEVYFTKIEDSKVKKADLTISSFTFSNNFTPKIEKIEFRDNLKVLKQGALTNLANLTALTLPASVTTIESGAIQNCPNLDLKILAKKSTIANSDYLNLGVKSITWVNN